MCPGEKYGVREVFPGGIQHHLALRETVSTDRNNHQTIEEVDLSVINSNYALQAGFNPVEDSLAIESADSTPYPNVIAVKEGNEDNEAIQALVKALQSDKVRDYIEETYGGAVVALF